MPVTFKEKNWSKWWWIEEDETEKCVKGLLMICYWEFMPQRGMDELPRSSPQWHLNWVQIANFRISFILRIYCYQEARFNWGRRRFRALLLLINLFALPKNILVAIKFLMHNKQEEILHHYARPSYQKSLFFFLPTTLNTGVSFFSSPQIITITRETKNCLPNVF